MDIIIKMVSKISQMDTLTAIILIAVALLPLLYLLVERDRILIMKACYFTLISIFLFAVIKMFTVSIGFAVTAAVIPMYIYDLILMKNVVGGKLTTKSLVYGAISISLSFILSFITIVHMPQGGSITPASMLPLIIFAYSFGVIPGIIAGTVYGLLQLIQDPYILHPVQVLLDYPLPFAMIGLAGIIKTKSKYTNIIVGTIIACLGRYVCHVISGFVFFASYTPAGQNSIMYSMIYNSFVLVDMAICLSLLLLPPVWKTINRIRTV